LPYDKAIVHSLPLFVRIAGRSVILVGEGPAADAKRRLIERAGGLPTADENAVAALAIVALEDDGEAIAAHQRLTARGLLVNVVDRPALCDFTLPAIVDRAPVLVAVGTGGASAGLAKAVRQRIEALLPPGLGALAAGMANARNAIRARWTTPDARRGAIDAAFEPSGALDPLTPRDDAATAIERWIGAAESGGEGAAAVMPIVLSSADPDGLTLRTARLLGTADRVYHATDVPAAILDRARADAARIPGAPPQGQPEPGLTLVLTMAAAR